jgi:hypothetical protein
VSGREYPSKAPLGAWLVRLLLAYTPPFFEACRPWLGRLSPTAKDLAALWIGQGKRNEALAFLAPIYAWFTEGFDTPDLKEAKVLLDQLQSRAIA